MACSTGGRAACTAAHKNMQDRFCVSHTPLSPCEDEGDVALQSAGMRATLP